MLARILAIIALAGLGGCDLIPVPDISWDAIGARAREAETPAPAGPANAHCQEVAHQRMQDAAYNGRDAQTQQAIYDGTYSDCVRYEQAHGPS